MVSPRPRKVTSQIIDPKFQFGLPLSPWLVHKRYTAA